MGSKIKKKVPPAKADGTLTKKTIINKEDTKPAEKNNSSEISKEPIVTKNKVDTEVTPVKVKTAEVVEKSKVMTLFEKHGVEKLYENSKGEFFTSWNLALASVNGKIDAVKTHKKGM